jgi:hypothetical protein
MRARVGLLVLAGAVCIAPSARAQRAVEEAMWAPFRAILDRYRAGDTKGAVDALLALGPGGIEQSSLGVSPSARQRVTVDVRAAAMLHADAADAVWLLDRKAAVNHVTVGRGWADVAEKGAPAFRRRWYLGAGLLLVEHGSYEGNVEPAAHHFEDACELMPDDVPLLTVTAWLEERSALAPARWDLKRDQHASAPRRAKGVYLRRAEERLAAALRVDPMTVEAALRLGRVRTLLGSTADAKTVLEPLLARPDVAARDAYLARLFLARVLEIEGMRPRAIELYRDGVARMSLAPSARLGLARLLHAEGDARAAGEVLEPTLTDPAETSDEDPWMDYLVGHVQRGPRLREMLRKEVQR